MIINQLETKSQRKQKAQHNALAESMLNVSTPAVGFRYPNNYVTTTKPVVGESEEMQKISETDEDYLMLGNELYDKIENMMEDKDPDLVGKITGMLLEFGRSEVLEFFKDEEKLAEQVNRALDVIQNFS